MCFFFQAEDGIRARNVTGVQTCALPISLSLVRLPGDHRATRIAGPVGRRERTKERSEERRVGKECRSRWSRYHSKKKKQERTLQTRPVRRAQRALKTANHGLAH